MKQEIYCPLIKGNCIGQSCVFFDAIHGGEELTLKEQKDNCIAMRALFELSIR
ncbi:MAG: hypothetical protein PHH85_09145 [Candidatus Methanoperedens sp.]|nr:hypothetical protein [Candidatus Methanoperedens sp.]